MPTCSYSPCLIIFFFPDILLSTKMHTYILKFSDEIQGIYHQESLLGETTSVQVFKTMLELLSIFKFQASFDDNILGCENPSQRGGEQQRNPVS